MSPAESAAEPAEHFAGPSLQVPGETPGRDPGSSDAVEMGSLGPSPHSPPPPPIPGHDHDMVYLLLCLAKVMAGILPQPFSI